MPIIYYSNNINNCHFSNLYYFLSNGQWYSDKFSHSKVYWTWIFAYMIRNIYVKEKLDIISNDI